MGAAEKLENLNMPPWEQHAGVINMPRFLYSASSSLHQTAHTGFLITCPFRREKSATKEAMGLLQKYVQLCQGTVTTLDRSDHINLEAAGQDQSLASVSVDVANCAAPLKTDLSKTAISSDNLVLQDVAPQPKRLKCSATETADCDGVSSNTHCVPSTGGGKDPISVPDMNCRKLEKDSSVEDMARCYTAPADLSGIPLAAVDLVPVKLAKMGVIFIAAPTLSSSSVVSIVSRLLSDIQAGFRSPPQWCHRILPVQATCPLKRSALHRAVSEHLKQHLRGEIKSDGPLKFAVAYNKRGADEEKISGVEEAALDRNQCITAVAEAVGEVFPNVTVDLTTPQVVIVVEALPLSGSKLRAVCAVSVVPGKLVDTKPRLCIKPLTIHSKKKEQI